MKKTVKIGDKIVGEGCPVYIAAEIGINHNGDMDITKKLIDVAQTSGCDAVKFQKRTPAKCVPDDMKDVKRETPWGIMTYLDYRYKIEFGDKEYKDIENYCNSRKIQWFASVWDSDSVDFLEKYNPVCYKIPSACLTDMEILGKVKSTGRPVVLSTGMSTYEEIKESVKFLGTDNLILLHCTSTYPCKPEELNLRVIETLKKDFDCPIGYSGHEVGLQTTYAAVTLGACFIERHITLDRAMWGSDQAASVEPSGLIRLVRDVRLIEKALGDGVKKLYESEIKAMKRLRCK